MTDGTRRFYEMFIRVLNFMTANAADFQNIAFVAATLTELQTETGKIAALAAGKVQSTAAAKDSTIERGDARDALREAMAEIADLWRSAVKDESTAANKFRMRYGTDQNLIATAKAFAAEAAANQQIFLERGMPADFVSGLQTKTTAFEQAVNRSEAARGTRVGANAAFDRSVKKCKDLVGNMEPVVKRTYRANNPQKWAEWTVASHVDRAPKPAKPAETPAPENQQMQI